MALTGRIIINGLDAFTNYGLVFQNDGLKSLLQMPQFKKVEVYDWHEEDGLEADLSAPLLDGRQFTLNFGISHPDAESEAQVLLSDLASQVYHTLHIPWLGRTYTVRYVSNSSFAQNARFDTLSLTFAEDAVTIPTVAVPTQETGISMGYFIDDADFALYGCTVVKGTRDSFLKFAATKEALKRSVSTLSGIIYDSGDTVRLKSRDITVKLHIRTPDVPTFWARWYALWNAVLAPEARTIEGEGMTFQCYYKSNAVQKFMPTIEGGVWCDFSITFAVLAYSRGDEWLYLVTEDGVPVIFEEDDESNPNYYIRIR